MIIWLHWAYCSLLESNNSRTIGAFAFWYGCFFAYISPFLPRAPAMGMLPVSLGKAVIALRITLL